MPSAEVELLALPDEKAGALIVGGGPGSASEIWAGRKDGEIVASSNEVSGKLKPVEGDLR